MFLIYQVHLMDNVRLKNYFVIHDIVLKKCASAGIIPNANAPEINWWSLTSLKSSIVFSGLPSQLIAVEK